ncbi:hypothetical protein DACRYDRAFT_103591 [Dacryopinax primogenitus]|uniref:Thioesterase domain-containing protein n=1 Tax=Dacryopinax primogenitus (strain DJM 731) TaxID=1858805 RepID=M5GFW8_DACPD|nr:uncharacterized protein DACRYDRAFT_103591 [Dacryopinax primogenitus]EJU06642.1 hypothetical protein DACRYDRAFT_103591 [Dacryopinax primogenitus]
MTISPALKSQETSKEARALWARILAESTPTNLREVVSQNLHLAALQIYDTHGKDQADGRKAVAIHEVVVRGEMTDGEGKLSRTWLTLLVELCSNLAGHALDLPTEGSIPSKTVALNLDVHSSPSTESSLRIVSSTISSDKRMQSVLCEVWEILPKGQTKVAEARVTQLQMPWLAKADDRRGWTEDMLVDRGKVMVGKL